jgi:hypothetical protein
MSEICDDALSLHRGTDEAKLLNRMKELVRLVADSGGVKGVFSVGTFGNLILPVLIF